MHHALLLICLWPSSCILAYRDDGDIILEVNEHGGECVAKDGLGKDVDGMSAVEKCRGMHHKDTCNGAWYKSKPSPCFWQTSSTPKGNCMAKDISVQHKDGRTAEEHCAAIIQKETCKSNCYWQTPDMPVLEGNCVAKNDKAMVAHRTAVEKCEAIHHKETCTASTLFESSPCFWQTPGMPIPEGKCVPKDTAFQYKDGTTAKEMCDAIHHEETCTGSLFSQSSPCFWQGTRGNPPPLPEPAGLPADTHDLNEDSQIQPNAPLKPGIMPRSKGKCVAQNSSVTDEDGMTAEEKCKVHNEEACNGNCYWQTSEAPILEGADRPLPGGPDMPTPEGQCVAKDDTAMVADGRSAKEKCKAIQHKETCTTGSWFKSSPCLWWTPDIPKGDCMAKDLSVKNENGITAENKCAAIRDKKSCKSNCYWHSPEMPMPKGKCVAKDDSAVVTGGMLAAEKCKAIVHRETCTGILSMSSPCFWQAEETEATEAPPAESKSAGAGWKMPSLGNPFASNPADAAGAANAAIPFKSASAMTRLSCATVAVIFGACCHGIF